jgi:hypothetical protein
MEPGREGTPSTLPQPRDAHLANGTEIVAGPEGSYSESTMLAVTGCGSKRENQ